MYCTLSDRSAEEWHAAIDRNLNGSLRIALSFVPYADWHEDARFSRFTTGFDHPFANIVWNARFENESVDAAITEAIAPMLKCGAPVMWSVGPCSRPADLAADLVRRGFNPGFPMPAMAVSLDEVSAGPTPEDVRILEVCSGEELEKWLHVVAVGSSLPKEVVKAFSYWPAHLGYGESSPLRAFVAVRSGEPVACSLLFLNDGIAGIYCVGTVPEARRQGLATAMTTTPLLLAREMGYKVGVLQASEMGESVYRKIGFRSYGTICMYVRKAVAV